MLYACLKNTLRLLGILCDKAFSSFLGFSSSSRSMAQKVKKRNADMLVLASPSFLISLNVQDLVVSFGQKNLDLSINQYNANEYRLGVASPFCHFFN